MWLAGMGMFPNAKKLESIFTRNVPPIVLYTTFWYDLWFPLNNNKLGQKWWAALCLREMKLILPKHSQQKKCELPQSTAWDVSGMGFLLGVLDPSVKILCSVSGSLTALPHPATGHHLMLLLLSTKAWKKNPIRWS